MLVHTHAARRQLPVGSLNPPCHPTTPCVCLMTVCRRLARAYLLVHTVSMQFLFDNTYITLAAHRKLLAHYGYCLMDVRPVADSKHRVPAVCSRTKAPPPDQMPYHAPTNCRPERKVKRLLIPEQQLALSLSRSFARVCKMPNYAIQCWPPLFLGHTKQPTTIIVYLAASWTLTPLAFPRCPRGYPPLAMQVRRSAAESRCSTRRSVAPKHHLVAYRLSLPAGKLDEHRKATSSFAQAF